MTGAESREGGGARNSTTQADAWRRHIDGEKSEMLEFDLLPGPSNDWVPLPMKTGRSSRRETIQETAARSFLRHGRIIQVWALPALLLVCLGSAAMSEPVQRNWPWDWPETEFGNGTVSFSDFESGGIPRDAIPAIDRPLFAKADRVSPAPDGREPVVSVVINGDVRAYPLSMLLWHEIVNDTVGGMPIVVTFCAPCNSGNVFDRRVDGSITTFGNTGMLHQGNRVLYDHDTESWWQQFDGSAILGSRAGETLKLVPARLESWSDFREAHPEGLVLVPDDIHRQAYGTTPYPGYDSAAGAMQFDGDYSGPGSPMIRVVAIDGVPEAWSFDHVRSRGIIRHHDFEISWQEGQVSALDASRIAEGRDVGTVIVERILPDGTREPVPYMVPFAFAYMRFHPDGKINHP